MYLQEPQNLDGLLSTVKKAVKKVTKAPGKLIKKIVGDDDPKPVVVPAVEPPTVLGGVPLDVAVGVGAGLLGVLLLTGRKKGRR